MSVTAETHQSAMAPYLSMAEAELESNSVTAVFREVLFGKVWPVHAGELGEGVGGERGSGGGGGGDGTPHTSSKSKRHPVPAVQPSTSSVAVQSLAPAAWQMASASVKVFLCAHGQPAFDAPHTEQPGRRDPHAEESLTSEQHRTLRRCSVARGEQMHVM